MHGRPRLPPGHQPDAAKLAKYREQAAQLNGAISLIVAAKIARNYDGKVLKVAAGVLLKNPDVYTLWNYRREACADVFAAGGDAARELAAAELRLTEQCLMEQPKSYCTWHHRRWVVEKGYTDLTAELELISKLLRADSRNFHGWNYRFVVVQLMGRSDEDELEYTHQLVASDFSNFSAWHYRSLLLPRVHAARGHRTLEQLLAALPAAAPESVRGEAAAPGLDSEPRFARNAPDGGGACLDDHGGRNAGGKVVGDVTRVDEGREDPVECRGGGGAEPAAPQASEITEAERRPESGEAGGGGGRVAEPDASDGDWLQPVRAQEGSGHQGGGAAWTVDPPAPPPPLPLYELATEFELLKTALCMDPGDASAWSYHRWLSDAVAENVRGASATDGRGESRDAARKELERQEALCLELIDVVRAENGGELLPRDPASKWPSLALAGLKALQAELLAEDQDSVLRLRREERELYEQLQQLDPLRKGFYADQVAKTLARC